MFFVLTWLAISFIELVSSFADFNVSFFSIAVRTTRQFFASPSRIWFGARSSIFFKAFFRALNFMWSAWRLIIFIIFIGIVNL